MKTQTSAGFPPVAVLVANRGFAIARSRSALISELTRRGWRVIVAAGEDSTFPELAALGAETIPIQVSRGGVAPFSDARLYRRLRDIYAKFQPRLVHHFHAKPILFGSMAAQATVPMAKTVATVTGVGHGFHSPSLRGRFARFAARIHRRADAVIFQNPDDRACFLERGWVDKSRAHLIVSSGVDTAAFLPSSRPPTSVRVSMVSRLLWDKGIREFVEAAQLVRNEIPDVQFVVGGESDPNHPNAVDERWMAAQTAKGVVTFAGYVHDMRAFLRESTVFVLPSFYGEGVPRVLIEAAATGIPVVTCDEPGCRDAVLHEETGLLVPRQDSRALAESILRLLREPALLTDFGRAARALATRSFDIRAITAQQLDVYRAVGAFDL